MLLLLFCGVQFAFADDGGYMTDINFREFVSSPDESGQSAILSGGTAVLQSIVTYIFLPIAIVFVVWKIVVIGICTMIGIDWTTFIDVNLGAQDKATQSKVALKDGTAKGKGSSPDAIKKIARDTIKGLIIVFCVWGIIELIMAAVYIFIEMGKTFGG